MKRWRYFARVSADVVREKLRSLTEGREARATLAELRRMSSRALAHLQKRQFDEAEPLFKQSLTLAEWLRGPNHPMAAACQHNLAGFYYARGQLSQAESSYKRVILLLRNGPAAGVVTLATSLGKLGMLYHDQGRHQTAEPLLLEALQLFEMATGTKSVETAVVLTNLARLRASQGQDAEAAALTLRAMSIFRKRLGTHHPHHQRLQADLDALGVRLYAAGSSESS